MGGTAAKSLVARLMTPLMGPLMEQRRKIVSGNWKMHKGLDQARDLARAIASGLEPGSGPEVVIFPASPFLVAVVEAVSKAAHPIGVGAQNVHPSPEGAFTGEISVAMVRSTGARHALAGHSERRQLFGDTDAFVGKKVRAILDLGLTPFFCVGETIEEREANKTIEVVARQLKAGLDHVDANKLARVVIAYEPVWAIGTGKTATPRQGAEVHRFIRSELAKRSKAAAEAIPILYGGSVKPANIRELLAEKEIDGALIGGASLEAAGFLEMCRAAREAG